MYLTPEYRSHVGEDLGMHPYYPITHVISTYVIGFISPAFLYSGLKLKLKFTACAYLLTFQIKPERTTRDVVVILFRVNTTRSLVIPNSI